MSISKSVDIAHDYLIQMGGAERVVACLLKSFPSSSLYTSFTDYPSLWNDFHHSRIRNSFMQVIPKSTFFCKLCFPIYPLAFWLHKIPKTSKNVIVSSSTFSKFIRTSRSTKKILYCHNPVRFLYDKEYVTSEIRNRWLRSVARLFFPPLRLLDKYAMRSYDVIVANSNNVKQRISNSYHLESIVVYPPVDTAKFCVSTVSSEYYLVLSRLVAYKRIDIVVEAFRILGRELHIVGDGPDFERLVSLSTPNVKFYGKLKEHEIFSQYSMCRAFLFPGEEDFGITPLEAQASGKPVIAYGKGGALETILEDETGLFFYEQTPSAVVEAVLKSDAIAWDPYKIRSHAEKFDVAGFIEKIESLLD